MSCMFYIILVVVFLIIMKRLIFSRIYHNKLVFKRIDPYFLVYTYNNIELRFICECDAKQFSINPNKHIAELEKILVICMETENTSSVFELPLSLVYYFDFTDPNLLSNELWKYISYGKKVKKVTIYYNDDDISIHNVSLMDIL